MNLFLFLKKRTLLNGNSARLLIIESNTIQCDELSGDRDVSYRQFERKRTVFAGTAQRRQHELGFPRAVAHNTNLVDSHRAKSNFLCVVMLFE